MASARIIGKLGTGRVSALSTAMTVTALLGFSLSGLLAARLGSWQIIGIGQCLLGTAVLFLLLPAPAFISAAGLFITGLGNGPLFPHFNYLTPQNFGKEASQSVMGTQMAASYIGIMLAPALCGILGQRIHMGMFPVYVLALYLLMLAATFRAKKILPKEKKAAEP